MSTTTHNPSSIRRGNKETIYYSLKTITNMRNKKLYNIAIRAALRVECLETSAEIFLYADAVYQAMLWGGWERGGCETD